MIDPYEFEVVDTSIRTPETEEKGGVVIDHVGYSRAFYELFEGAIYLHQARQYAIVRLDLEQRRALCKPTSVNYYTSSRNHTDVNPTNKLEARAGGTVSSGWVHVVAHVWGWRRVELRTGRVLEVGTFSLPPLRYETRGFWCDVPKAAQTAAVAAGLDFVGGVHAANHALLAVVPLLVLCDAQDVDTEHVYHLQRRPRPARLVVFDKRPGGVGIAEAVYAHARAALAAALALVEGCCGRRLARPSCVHDHRCSDYHGYLDKRRVHRAACVTRHSRTTRTREPPAAACRQPKRTTTTATARRAARRLGTRAARRTTTRARAAARQRGLPCARTMDRRARGTGSSASGEGRPILTPLLNGFTGH